MHIPAILLSMDFVFHDREGQLLVCYVEDYRADVI